MQTDVNMRELFEAGAHFGHLTRFRDPSMSPYLYGIRNNVHIINLEKTLPLFRQALQFLNKTAAKGGKILFVGTKKAARDIIVEQAIRAGMPYVNHRWLGGMLTNYKTIRQSIRRLVDIERMMQDGTVNFMTKKEGLQLKRELDKLERGLGGIKEMGGLPDVLVVIDVGAEKIAIAEANRLGIPVVGIVDTNHNPEGVDFVVPANDDSMRALQLYISKIADAIIEGKSSQKPNAGKFQEEFVELPVEDSPFAENEG